MAGVVELKMPLQFAFTSVRGRCQKAVLLPSLLFGGMRPRGTAVQTGWARLPAGDKRPFRNILPVMEADDCAQAGRRARRSQALLLADRLSHRQSDEKNNDEAFMARFFLYFHNATVEVLRCIAI